ncbi:cell-division protein essential for Z-ring assembly [Kyrpidia spormannii]|uniref:Cell-division protein essential for Z-ring assembly n=2 Tax=Kyrpidia spormannii TaxID=2055160 RepID=A0ACA8Z8K3_9BACL|nr:cell-division protein essential for Z-ring assembly [Kyrpidia spormannii]CAB3392723.1 cell-division protein essential for Z-ring assembly [Kyrpidia spormannii]
MASNFLGEHLREWVWGCRCLTKGDIIVSLDVGTSKIRIIIGEVTGSNLNVIGVGTAPGDGIRQGAIVDIDKTVRAIREAVEHAERMVGVHIQSAYVGVSGSHIALQSSHGVVAVSSPDREITEDDVDRVLQAARVMALPPEREIVDVVPKEYIVDGLEGITDPRGMIGVRLEVDAHIITGSRTVIHNLVRCVERAEMEIAGLVLLPLAAGSVALSPDEKKLGVVLVDLGAGATTISVFERGALAGVSVLPVGGDYVTNDIAIGLRTQTDVAEKIKSKHGWAMVALAPGDERFKVPRIGNQDEKDVSAQELATIIEPRLQEMFFLVRREIERMGVAGEIPGGYVLYGGVSATRGIDKLAEHELAAPVRVAVPEFLGVRDTSFVNGVGIIRYVANHSYRRAVDHQPARKGASPGLIRRIKSWFADFM